LQADRSTPSSFASYLDIRNSWTHLVRRPSFQQPVIDGVRAVAVLWVVALHVVFFHMSIYPAQVSRVFNHPVTAWLANGMFGVDLFFVISGFLIGSLLFEEFKTSGSLSFSRFYVRRFLRLIPVYTAVMMLGLYFLHRIPGRPEWSYAVNFWANTIYVNNLLPVARQYLPWCWSLAIEEQFYLLMPACILLFMGLGKGRLRILLGLTGLSLAIRYAVIHSSGIVPPYRFAPYSSPWNNWFDVVYDKPWMRFGGLLAGVGGAYLNTCFAPQLKRFFAHIARVTVISIACLALMVHIAYTGMGSSFFDRIPYLARELWWTCVHDAFSLSAIFLILASMHTPRLFAGVLARFLSWKGFYPIAQISYSVYLVHEMIFMWLFPRLAPHFARHLSPFRAMAASGIIGLVIVFGLATSLYILIERPCMRLRSHPATIRLIDLFRDREAEPQFEEA
jgi:peptidoglycan/LPS O-acetylase OafA/YrhL